MSNNKSFLVVGVGEILWDVFPKVKNLGGAPANFAYHTAQFGADAYIVSCVGNDPYGSEIIQQLKEMKLHTDCIEIDDNYPTGIVNVMLDKKGAPSYIINENVAWDHITMTDQFQDLASKADAMCFGTLCQRSEISRDTILSLLKSTRPDCLKVYDINLRQHYYNKNIILNSLKMANVFKVNHEELPVVANLLAIQGTESEILLHLIEQFELKLIVLTRGKNGSLLFSRECCSEHPMLPTEAIDSVGAGDSFTAAVVMGLLQGHDLEVINATANRIGSYVCSQKGAMPLIPKDLLKFQKLF